MENEDVLYIGRTDVARRRRFIVYAQWLAAAASLGCSLWGLVLLFSASG